MAILTARGGNGTPVSEAEVKAMLATLDVFLSVKYSIGKQLCFLL